MVCNHNIRFIAVDRILIARKSILGKAIIRIEKHKPRPLGVFDELISCPTNPYVFADFEVRFWIQPRQTLLNLQMIIFHAVE